MNDIMVSDVVVAHNVNFDRKMIISELIRLLPNEKVNNQIKKMMTNKFFECTMVKTKPICNIQKRYDYISKKTGKSGFFYKTKSPKLIESYEYFFGYKPNPEMLHDAIMDVVICLRVYCICLENGFDICGKNKDITGMIMKISPPHYKCPNNKSISSIIKQISIKNEMKVKNIKNTKKNTSPITHKKTRKQKYY
jgi:DNA polymerase III epsilon subunit-like protein